MKVLPSVAPNYLVKNLETAINHKINFIICLRRNYEQDILLILYPFDCSVIIICYKQFLLLYYLFSRVSVPKLFRHLMVICSTVCKTFNHFKERSHSLIYDGFFSIILIIDEHTQIRFIYIINLIAPRLG